MTCACGLPGDARAPCTHAATIAAVLVARPANTVSPARRPRPLPARLLAELAAVAHADASARMDAYHHDDLSDRPRGPRAVTTDDEAEHARLRALSRHLERRARRARWTGSIWDAPEG